MWEFRDRLERELEQRRASNTRYSLRAFAAFLETDHSTLSQILRGARPIPTDRLRVWGKKLGMSREEIAVYVAAQYVPSRQDRDRQEQLRHWTAEALAIVNDPCHEQIVLLTRRKGIRGDSRELARQLGVSVDRINIALSRLLRLRLLELGPAGRWKDLLPRQDDVSNFRRIALIRIREMAAKDGVRLLRLPK
jgi:transcriptional regulator with XRE-family HTH domain